MTGPRRASGRPGQSRSGPARSGGGRSGRPVRGVPAGEAERADRPAVAPVRSSNEPGRSASRPASARRAAAAGAAKRTRAPQPGGRFTGRATALALVLGALLLAYAYPMRIYLNQQAQIAALESSQEVQKARIKD